MLRTLAPLIAAALLLYGASSYVIPTPAKRTIGQVSNHGRRLEILSAKYSDHFEAELDSDTPTLFNRRDAITASINSALLLSTMLMGSNKAEATDATGIGSDPKHPIVILGAGGQCGKLCTKILADKGLYVLATTRDGRSVLEDSPFVTYGACDLTKAEVVNQALAGASGVIFAASASGKRKGGVPRDVDYIGAMNTASACIQQKVPKLVLLSAGTVTRPTSKGFTMTNSMIKDIYGAKIMDYKIAGEAAVRDIYSQKGGKGQAYTIIRPGALTGGKSKGSSKLHVSQGDVYSGEVSRQDVALVTVEALLKGKSTDFTTFELNQVGGLYKCIPSLDDLPSELVHAGAPTFGELLDGLVTDSDMKAKYPSIVNDFRGDIE